MSFSSEWDDQYRANAHMSVWPWSDLVSLVHRQAPPAKGFNSVLELGCGAGANIPFFRSVGVDYHGVDGSATAVELLHRRFPDLAEKIRCGDFTRDRLFTSTFDLVVDRSALLFNRREAMSAGLKLATDQMRPGGRYIAVDWFSMEHEGVSLGIAVDGLTRRDMPERTGLGGLGDITFCDRSDIVELLTGAGLKLVFLQHKRVDELVPEGGRKLGFWNFVAEKP